MTPEFLMMAGDAIEQAGHTAIFIFLVLGAGTVIVTLTSLFACYAIRNAWHWLTRGSWNRVLVSAEQKIFEGEAEPEA